MTFVINFDDTKKKAYIPKRVGKAYVSLELGSKEGIEQLATSKIESYSFGCDPTFFEIRKLKNGNWEAFQEKVEGHLPVELTFNLGVSKEITYSRLLEALAHFNHCHEAIGVEKKREATDVLLPKLTGLIRNCLAKNGFEVALMLTYGWRPFVYIAVGKGASAVKEYVEKMEHTGKVGDRKLVVPPLEYSTAELQVGNNNYLLCLTRSLLGFDTHPKGAKKLRDDLRKLRVASKFNPFHKRWWEIWNMPLN